MNTGLISYVAHPDLLNFSGEDKDFQREEWRRLILEAIRLDIPLEYNLLGMNDGRAYPAPDFWREVAELGAKSILGCDSHAPERVARRVEIDRAHEFLDSLGIVVLDEIELKKVQL